MKRTRKAVNQWRLSNCTSNLQVSSIFIHIFFVDTGGKEICSGNILVLLSMQKKMQFNKSRFFAPVAIWRKINQVKPNLHSACVYVIIYVVDWCKDSLCHLRSPHKLFIFFQLNYARCLMSSICLHIVICWFFVYISLVLAGCLGFIWKFDSSWIAFCNFFHINFFSLNLPHYCMFAISQFLGVRSSTNNNQQHLCTQTHI